MNHINFNCDVSPLKSYSESGGLIQHVWINIFRKDSPEMINKDIENKTLKDWRTSKNFESDMKLLKERDKEKLLRFFTTTLNLTYSKENLPKIIEWANQVKDFLEDNFNCVHIELHLNESKPHIHAIILNMDQKRERVGNFNKRDENIKLSGKYYIDEKGETINLTPKKIKRLQKTDPNFFKKYKMMDHGKDTLNRIWKQGEEINKEFCKKYNLEFNQEPTNEFGMKRKIKREELKNLTIEEFRQKMKIENKNNFVYEKRLKDLENENKQLKVKNEFLEKDNKKKQDYILKDKQINNLEKEIEQLKKEKNEIDDFENWLGKNLGVKGKNIIEKFINFDNKKTQKNNELKNENEQLKQEIEQLKNKKKQNEYQK